MEKPNYRLEKIETANERSIIASLSLRNSIKEIGDKTFCSCDKECDCNRECSCDDNCSCDKECRHCKCDNYCNCDTQCRCDDYDCGREGRPCGRNG